MASNKGLSEKRDGKSNRERLRGNEKDKWRWSLLLAMTWALWWYSEGSENKGWERVHIDGTHFRLLKLDNGFRHHSVFTMVAWFYGGSNVFNRKKEISTASINNRHVLWQGFQHGPYQSEYMKSVSQTPSKLWKSFNPGAWSIQGSD